MDKVQQFTHANRTVTIYVDPDPINPIKDYDQYTQMICAHRRYNLGHAQTEPMTEAEVRENYDGVLAVLPLYLYDHSGITISTGAFSCIWDSGQVGWAYITRDRIAKMGDTTEYAENDERLLAIIRSDVESYDPQDGSFSIEISRDSKATRSHGFEASFQASAITVTTDMAISSETCHSIRRIAINAS
jgi:hypothetical protein